MSRLTQLRLSCPDAVKHRIEQAQAAQFYVVQELGPMAFVLREEAGGRSSARRFKVCLGSSQTCSCPTHLVENDLCVHLLWVMIKMFQVPLGSEILYQTSLVEREIAEILQWRKVKPKAEVDLLKRESSTEKLEDLPPGHVPVRPIEPGDVCPICMEELSASGYPMTHCKTGCGNSLHVKCLKILLEHQTKSMGLDRLKCPLCRNDFGAVDDLKKEFASIVQAHHKASKHYGMSCSECGVNPIEGKCHRCATCKAYSVLMYLCDPCFTKGVHSDHSFRHKTNRNSKWFPSIRSDAPSSSAAATRDESVIDSITELDCDEIRSSSLANLDADSVNQHQPVPLHVIATFPTRIYRRASPRKRTSTSSTAPTAPHPSCTVCATQITHGTILRTLPCSHYFHQPCVDRWLLTNQPTCPTCHASVLLKDGASAPSTANGTFTGFTGDEELTLLKASMEAARRKARRRGSAAKKAAAAPTRLVALPLATGLPLQTRGGGSGAGSSGDGAGGAGRCEERSQKSGRGTVGATVEFEVVGQQQRALPRLASTSSSSSLLPSPSSLLSTAPSTALTASGRTAGVVASAPPALPGVGTDQDAAGSAAAAPVAVARISLPSILQPSHPQQQAHQPLLHHRRPPLYTKKLSNPRLAFPVGKNLSPATAMPDVRSSMVTRLPDFIGAAAAGGSTQMPSIAPSAEAGLGRSGGSGGDARDRGGGEAQGTAAAAVEHAKFAGAVGFGLFLKRRPTLSKKHSTLF